MDLQFNKIIIDNFLSFGHAEVDLNNLGFCLIEGINNNLSDNASSNGAGKSSLFNAIAFALTGETIQGISSNLNNMFTTGDMCVKLYLNVDSDSFLIERSRDSKGKPDLKIAINGVDKSGKGVRESEALLEQYLPELTGELLGEVILIGQGMPHKFSDNTPSGRKELLEKLSKSDFMIEDIRNKVQGRLLSLRSKQDKDLIEVSTKRSNLTYFSEQLEKLIEKRDNYTAPDYKQLISNCESEIKELEDKLTEVQTAIDTKNNLLDTSRNDLQKLSQLELDELKDEEVSYSNYNKPLLDSKVDIKSKSNILAAEIKRLKSITDVCPTCGQKIPGVMKPDTSAQEKELERLTEELAEVENKLKQSELNHNNYRQEIQDNYKDKKKELQESVSTLTSELTNLKLVINNYRAKKSTKEKELAGLCKDQEYAEKDFNNLLANIKDLEAKINTLFREAAILDKNIEETQLHIDVDTKIDTFTKRDFRGLILSNIIEYIETVAKNYCLDIFKNSDLTFQLNGNNIEIKYQGKNLENLSGGEQQKVDLILQFAIRSMIQQYTGFTSNILVLDEILDNLDAKGSDEILNFVSTKLSDIDSIFIISHHADSLNICNDNTITIIKDEKGISRIYEK